MTGRPVGRFEWEHLFRRCLLPSTVKVVGFAMATYADVDGSRVFPGAELLARVTGLSERSVRAALASLRDLGLVEQVFKGGYRGAKAQASVYRLTVSEDLFERVDLLTVEGEMPPNLHHVQVRQPAPRAGSSVSELQETARSNLQETAPQPAPRAAQPARDDLQPAPRAPHQTKDQPPTRSETRVVAYEAQPLTARATDPADTLAVLARVDELRAAGASSQQIDEVLRGDVTRAAHG